MRPPQLPMCSIRLRRCCGLLALLLLCSHVDLLLLLQLLLKLLLQQC